MLHDFVVFLYIKCLNWLDIMREKDNNLHLYSIKELYPLLQWLVTSVVSLGSKRKRTVAHRLKAMGGCFKPVRQRWLLCPRQVKGRGLQRRGLWDAKWVLCHLLLVSRIPEGDRPLWNGRKAVMFHNKMYSMSGQRGMVGQEDIVWWLRGKL